MKFTERAAKREFFRLLMVPVVFAALAGFYGGAAIGKELLLLLGQSPVQARILGTFLGGVSGGVLCALLILALLRPWLKRT